MGMYAPWYLYKIALAHSSAYGCHSFCNAVHWMSFHHKLWPGNLAML